MACLNPLHIVLSEELLVTGEAFVVHLRVAPTIQDIAALSSISSRMPCGFFCGCAVVDDVHFVHPSAREGDLVQSAVVIQAVAVHPVSTTGLISRGADIIDVEQFRMVSDHTVVVFGFVIILD